LQGLLEKSYLFTDVQKKVAGSCVEYREINSLAFVWIIGKSMEWPLQYTKRVASPLQTHIYHHKGCNLTKRHTM